MKGSFANILLNPQDSMAAEEGKKKTHKRKERLIKEANVQGTMSGKRPPNFSHININDYTAKEN